MKTTRLPSRHLSNRSPLLRIVLFGLIAVISLSNAQGRLWDTREQVDARYGKPFKVEGDQSHGTVCTYNYQHFHVIVTFLDGKSQSELFYRSDNKYLVPIEVIKLTQLNSRENYVWDSGNGMFVLVDIQRRGKPIAIAARFPDTRDPWSLHICTAEFVKRFGSKPSKAKLGPGRN